MRRVALSVGAVAAGLIWWTWSYLQNPLLAWCLLIVAYAVMGMFWMKREGEQEWKRYQQRQRWNRLIEATKGVAVAFGQLHTAMQKVGKAFEKAVREMEGRR